MKLTKTLALLALSGLGMQLARADSLPCAEELIDVGANVGDLLQKCGEPSAKDGDRWIYDRGPEELKMIVRVSAGYVQSIQPESSETP